MGAHTTSDDPSRYRRAGELQEWQAKDPIRRLRLHLERSEQADAAFFADVDADADEFAVRLRAGCLAIPDPQPESMFDHAYHEPHAQLEEDRAWFTRYQGSFTAAQEAAR